MFRTVSFTSRYEFHWSPAPLKFSAADLVTPCNSSFLPVEKGPVLEYSRLDSVSEAVARLCFDVLRLLIILHRKNQS